MIFQLKKKIVEIKKILTKETIKLKCDKCGMQIVLESDCLKKIDCPKCKPTSSSSF